MKLTHVVEIREDEIVRILSEEVKSCGYTLASKLRFRGNGDGTYRAMVEVKGDPGQHETPPTL
jgi:hypothetical protein